MFKGEDTVIEIENVSKRYRVGAKETQAETFAGQIYNLVKAPFRNFKRLKKLKAFEKNDENINWALKEINFKVKRGEVLGIIGHNGAGKSTLLKVLSHITEPTTGEIKLKGRVSSLLEVGTGFHPELTGRDNVYMNGTILGMTKKEVDAKFDEIVEFSGVERYIDTPVKFYSSGMKVRLGFSVAAHLEPEILIIDEVLAVGDVSFQKKCLGKMDDISHSEGRTVLFVSHNMGMIRDLCDRSILLKGGYKVFDGETEEAINKYFKTSLKESESGKASWDSQSGEKEIFLKSVSVIDQEGNITDKVDVSKPTSIEIIFRVNQRIRGLRWVMHVMTSDGINAFSTTDHNTRGSSAIEPGLYKSTCIIPADLLNKKEYYLKFSAEIPGVKLLIKEDRSVKFYATGRNNHGSHYSNENWGGAVAPKINWEIDKKIGD